MSVNKEYQQFSGVNRSDWFERWEQELKQRDTISFQSVHPYIFFKLAHDFAFSRDSSIDLHDPLAINYFMGDFCYDQVVKDFNRSAIVMQSLTERMYFGSPWISQKRMRNFSFEIEKSAGDFEVFISCLEEKVFQSRLSNLGERQKETLGMILRIINQGVSATAIKLLNAHLQVRSGESDKVSSIDLNDIRYLMRPDMGCAKGSSQIDIVYYDDGKIQLYRREYLKVQKLDMESLVQPDNTKDERWCIMTFLSRKGNEESSGWRLHFSASKIKNDCESKRISLNIMGHLGRVSSDSLLSHSGLSTSSGGSPGSIDSVSSSVENPENGMSNLRPKRRKRRHPIRDLLDRRKANKVRLVPTSIGSYGSTTRNSSTYFTSGNTDSPERSPSVCILTDADELKENEAAIRPLRKRAMLSDELINRIKSEASTAFGEISGFGWV